MLSTCIKMKSARDSLDFTLDMIARSCHPSHVVTDFDSIKVRLAELCDCIVASNEMDTQFNLLVQAMRDPNELYALCGLYHLYRHSREWALRPGISTTMDRSISSATAIVPVRRPYSNERIYLVVISC